MPTDDAMREWREQWEAASAKRKADLEAQEELARKAKQARESQNHEVRKIYKDKREGKKK
jgi:hypothetical protein